MTAASPDRQAGAAATKRGTLASTVHERLRLDILSGALPPGEKLRMEALRERYDVGSSPLREALNRLVSDGLVTLEDQKGFRVAPVSLADLQELTRTRCLINEIALREAIRNGDAAWEEQIVVAFHRMVRAAKLAKTGDVGLAERAETHRAFHRALIEGCGLRWLLAFHEALFDAAGRYQELSMRAGSPPRNVDAEHRPIMDAVLARDTARATRLLNEHALRTAEIIGRLPEFRPARRARR
jgi:GntR family transcriptional regulator, carbon starvation induced regulator